MEGKNIQTTDITVSGGYKVLVSTDEHMLVTIKPLCQVLGVDHRSQAQKIKEHPVLGEALTLAYAIGADGKRYKMLCLPMEYVFGWIYSISPRNVKEEAKQTLINNQKQCSHALFEQLIKFKVNK